MLRHEIRIAGPGVGEHDVSGPLMAELLKLFVDGARGVLRFHLQGRSRPKGPKPAWLPAADFAFIPTADAHVVRLQGAPLEHALPDRFRQRELFEEFDPAKSALDLFEDALEDALRGNADSELFDDGLAAQFAKFRDLYGAGVSSLEIVNGRSVPVTLDGLARVEHLLRQTPHPRTIRVAGKLDLIRYSDRMFELILASGEKLRGVADSDEIEEDELKALWGEPVVLSGVAVFRPSGAPLRIEARAIARAGEDDLAVWGRRPLPLSRGLETASLRVPQGPRSGLNAIIGRWPGDEPDDVIERALGTMS